MVEDIEEPPVGWAPAMPTSDQQIWRYLDISQFYSLMQKSELWFSKNAEFFDPYEGVLPKKVQKKIVEEQFPDSWPDRTATATYDLFRHITFSNCWHMNDKQSMAMWQAYNDRGKEVAIKSTAGRLTESISKEPHPSKMSFGKVKYIDYDSIENFPINTLSPYFHKRLSFEHEQEFRAVVQDIESIHDSITEENEGVPITEMAQIVEDDDKKGIGVEADLDKLITSVYVSPVVGDWIKSIVQTMVEESDNISSDTDVIKSNIASTPEYWNPT